MNHHPDGIVVADLDAFNSSAGTSSCSPTTFFETASGIVSKLGSCRSFTKTEMPSVSWEAQLAKVAEVLRHDIGIVRINSESAREATPEIDRVNPDAGFYGRFRPFWLGPEG